MAENTEKKVITATETKVNIKRVSAMTAMIVGAGVVIGTILTFVFAK